MAKEKGGTLRFIYGVFLAILTVVVGGLFIVQVWSIYRSAPQSPYTVQSISTHFNQIAVPVWIWVAAVAINVVLAYLFPETEKRPKAQVDISTALERTKKRLPTEKEFLPTLSAIEKKQRTFRAIVGGVCIAFMLAAGVLCLATVFDFFYFPVIKAAFFTAQNGLVDRVVQCVILAAAALVVGCIAAYLCALSKKREQKSYLDVIVQSKKKKAEVAEEQSPWFAFVWSVVRSAVTGGKHVEKKVDKQLQNTLEEGRIPPVQPTPKKEKGENPKATLFWRIGLCAVGVGLIVLGIFNGGMKDVLLKAINICTQCIGLG